MAPIPSPADLARGGGWTTPSTGRASVRPREILRGIAIGGLVTVLALAAKGALVTGTEAGVAYLPMFAALPIAALAGGLVGGVTFVLAASIADAFLFHTQNGAPFAGEPEAFVRFLLFIPVGLWLVWLIASLATLRRSARVQADTATELLDAFPDAALLVDRDLRILRANRRLAELGWDPARLVGQPATVVLPRLAEMAASPDGQVGTIDLVGADGTESPVDVLRSRVETPAGPAVLIAARDVQDRIDHEVRLLRLASAERRTVRALQGLLASMDEGVAVSGPDGDIVLVNHAMTALTGGPIHTRDELAAAIGVPLVSGDVRQPAGGRWLRLTVRDEEEAGLVIIRDTTAEREAAVAQEAFIGVLSHELRTPVTTILGIAHLLARPPRDEAVQPRDLANDLQAEAGRLDDLIEDLLILSRAQGGTVVFEPEPVLVQHAITAAVQAEAQRYPAVEFRTEIEPGLPPVSGDATFVDQVLRNLIGNAGKYTVARSNEVTVSAHGRDGVVEVAVLDRGPGFAAEDADRLFDLYFRSSRTARTKAGSGIGLYVVRTLVEAMGGRIDARLREPHGSAFTFTLPVLAPDDREVME